MSNYLWSEMHVANFTEVVKHFEFLSFQLGLLDFYVPALILLAILYIFIMFFHVDEGDP